MKGSIGNLKKKKPNPAMDPDKTEEAGETEDTPDKNENQEEQDEEGELKIGGKTGGKKTGLTHGQKALFSAALKAKAKKRKQG